MSFSLPAPPLGYWFSVLASALDPRSGPRLMGLFVGALLAKGRRTVTSWIRAAGLSGEYRRCYPTLWAAGRRAERIAVRVLLTVLKPLLKDAPRVVFALDDTPTKRSGPHVEGAGIHHHPTPGTAGGPFVYGHVWVVLAVLVAHPLWGVIALPLLARLYIRRKDLARFDREHRPAFATKLEMAADLMRWARSGLGAWGKPLWVVADGAYAKATFLKPMIGLGIVVVSRLRKDSALWTPPPPRPASRRGRPRIYGEHRIDLAKRAGQRRGWVRGTFVRYGKATAKRYKTFVATWRPAGGAIRVVLVDEPDGWRAFFCTDLQAAVADILGLVADRFSLETCFRDLKQVVGAGQQQVRNRWANVGAFHLCLWIFTMTECWAWDLTEEDLVEHRRSSPWDDQPRRPSHADKRRACRREFLAEEIKAVLPDESNRAAIRELAERLLDLAA
jgi:hypothetical protein